MSTAFARHLIGDSPVERVVQHLAAVFAFQLIHPLVGLCLSHQRYRQGDVPARGRHRHQAGRIVSAVDGCQHEHERQCQQRHERRCRVAPEGGVQPGRLVQQPAAPLAPERPDMGQLHRSGNHDHDENRDDAHDYNEH